VRRPGLRSLNLAGRKKPYLIAHRGNRVVCPENTLAAFRRALSDGADILETDLHLTSDEEFVCIHDPTVDRTTNGRGAVAEMSLARIQALSASCGREGFEGEHVPCLRELAALLPAQIALALELKTDRFLEPQTCLKLVQELEPSGVLGRTVVLSFSMGRLMMVRQVSPDIPIGWITAQRPWPLPAVDLLGPLWPFVLLNPVYVLAAHLRGQAVCPLDPLPDGRLRLYCFLGCDAVLSDNPGATRLALDRMAR